MYQDTPNSHASNPSFVGQWQGPEIRTRGHGNNKLEGMRGEFSAKIVHAVNQLSLHFNIIRKKSHPLTFIKRANVKIHCHLLSVFVLGDEKLNNEGQIPMPIVTDEKRMSSAEKNFINNLISEMNIDTYRVFYII